MQSQRFEESEFIDKVVSIRRVAKVVKGGRRFAFSALVVVGDGKGRVGFSVGKAREVPEAIRKGFERARRHMIEIPVLSGTIPYEVTGHFGATTVLLKPAPAGTGVIAGTSVRSVLDAAGVHNILTKALGSSNPINVVAATFAAIGLLDWPAQKAAKRGKTLEELGLTHFIGVKEGSHA